MRYWIVLSLVLVGVLTVNSIVSAAKPTAATKPAMPDLADYRSKLVDAQHAVDAAQKSLDGIVGQLRTTFEASDDWKQAEAALKDAQTARDAAIAKVTAALQNDAGYKALVEQKSKASTEVQRLRESGNASSQQMTAALNASLDATTAVTQREQSAISYDDAARSAVGKYNDAAAHVAQLRQKFLESIKTSPELKAAQDALADAKKNRDQAVTDLADAENRAQQIASASPTTQPKQPTTHSSGRTGGSRRNRLRIL